MRKFLLLVLVALFLTSSLLQPQGVAGKQGVEQLQAQPEDVQVATFPFSDGFESGTLNSAYWTQLTTGKGVTKVSAENSHWGAKHVVIGQDLTGAATVKLILTIDLSSQPDVYLDFWWRKFGVAGFSDNSGVFLSVDGGTTRIKLRGFEAIPTQYRHDVIDLNKVAGTHGITLNSSVQIEFSYEADYWGSGTNTGFRIDDVQLTKRSSIATTFPFQDGFEDDLLKQGWFSAPVHNGVVEVSSDEPQSGSNHIFLGQQINGKAQASLMMIINLENLSDVYLDFWWRKIGNFGIGEGSGVYISVNDGASWTELVPFDANPINYRHDVVDLYKVAFDKGLTPLHNHVWVSFYYESDYWGSGASNGFRLDNVRLTTRSQQQIQFPFQDNLESDTFAQGIFPLPAGNGVASLNQIEPFSGQQHLFLGQRLQGGAWVNLLMMSDLTGKSDVYLEFWWKKVGNFGVGGNSGIYVSGDGGANWENLFKFSGSPVSYRRETFDVKAFASAQGMVLNKNFQLRFYYESDYWGSGNGSGFYMDDIKLVPKSMTGETPIPTHTPTGTVLPTSTPTATGTRTPTFTPSSTPINTSTHTPTVTPTNTPLATSTTAPTATPTDPAQKPPKISEVRPNQGNSAETGDIHIYGQNFVNGATVSLNSTVLATTFIDSTHLQAVAPAGLAAGVYNVIVTNPGSESDTLSNGYRVFDATTNDDLTSSNDGIWTDPVALHAQSSGKIGLFVSRQGGKQALQNVDVNFYLGDPNNGGTLIGKGTIAILGPRSQASASVTWLPPAAGNHTIYAVLDPDNTVTETFEDNNRFSRTIEVLPALPDQLAPRVDSFTINDSAQSTNAQTVRLSATASDPGSPATGIGKVLYIEYEYSSSAQQWVSVRSSGWLDLATASTNHNWLLSPASGMKYLQAWAADKAGNVSLFPGAKFINFVPDEQSIGLNQRKVFRYTLTAGQTLSARLETINGDPDLYIWSPEDNAPPWVSNLATGVDDYAITANVAGNYQVEVYGFAASKFRLIVTVSSVAESTVIASTTSGIDPNKPQLTTPPVGDEVVPSSQVAIATAGVSQIQVFLPLVRK